MAATVVLALLSTSKGFRPACPNHMNMNTRSIDSSQRGWHLGMRLSALNCQENSFLKSLHKSRLISQPEYDPTHGVIVCSTQDTTLYQYRARQALSTQWHHVQHYCCKQPSCTLCFEHNTSSRANLMLDYVKTLSQSGCSNSKKFQQVLDRNLCSTWTQFCAHWSVKLAI